MKKNLSQEEIASLCLELSLLLHAGIPVGDALSLLSEQSDAAYRPLLEELSRKVDDGAPLSAAMEQAGVFPTYVLGLVEMGERTGRTEEALKSLADYYESRVRQRQRIRSALLYPAIMLILMLVVVAVLLMRVLPIFNDVYASLGGQLTGLAGSLLSLGRWLDGILPVLWVILAVAVVVMAVLCLAPSLADKLLAGWRRSHGDRGISRKMNDARLAQALAMGMASGLPLDESLALTETLMADVPVAQARCRACRERLLQGTSLATALRESDLLPPAQCRLLELGQRSGMADATMGKIAEDLAQESADALYARVSRVEPALVLFCSVLVGLILLSVMLPLTHIMAAIG